MSFVLNKNINLKYILGRKCPTQTVILSMQSGDIYIFRLLQSGVGAPPLVMLSLSKHPAVRRIFATPDKVFMFFISTKVERVKP